MERNNLGKWTSLAGGQTQLAVHPEPRATVNPFSHALLLKAVPASEHQPERQKQSAQNFVNAIVPQLCAGNDLRDHYIVRAEEARLLADAADEQQIKVIHLELAARYYSLANLYFDWSKDERRTG